MKILLFIIPILVLAGSIYLAYRQRKNGCSAKRAFAIHIGTFLTLFILIACLSVTVFASENTENTAATTAAATENAETTAASSTDSGKSFGLLGAALATGLAGIGGGIAVGGAAPAAIGATSEDPKNFAKALIFVALGEGIALYGLLMSILILNKI